MQGHIFLIYSKIQINRKVFLYINLKIYNRKYAYIAIVQQYTCFQKLYNSNETRSILGISFVVNCE